MNAIGYACKLIGPPRVAVRGLTLARATPDNLREVVEHNLAALSAMIEYNAAHDIHLFRISSDLVPLATHPDGKFNWQKLCKQTLATIGARIAQSNQRVSMHPGQYTVINSPDPGVAERAAEDLCYHADILDLLGTGQDCKIVLHVGGVYGDREQALDRFAQRFARLPESVRRRLVIENDDRSFAIDEVYALAKRVGIPAVLDTLHFALLPPKKGDVLFWLDQCAKTWKKKDGPQKIHYSQQLDEGKPGAHSQTIHVKEFVDLFTALRERKLDIMLEVKDKNLSALKCIHCTAHSLPRAVLTESWAQYKYSVLERSPAIYNRIRAYLKNPRPNPIGYYTFVDEALDTPVRTGPAVTTFEHVWGYFSKNATESEKRKAAVYADKIADDLHHRDAAKRFLFKLAEREQEEYLLNSYYFDI